MENIKEVFGTEMSDAVKELIDQGIDSKEIDQFLEQIKPIMDTEPSSTEIREEQTTADLMATDLVLPESKLECKSVDMPPHHTFNFWEANLINIAIGAAVPALGIAVGILRIAANKDDLTIGFGPVLGGGFIGGISASVGLICAPNDTFGFYGNFSGLIGAIGSISLTAQYTFLKGGIESWAGAGKGVTIGGGDVIVGSVSLLMDEKEEFAGVSIAAGLGIGEPLEVYVSYSISFLKIKQQIDCSGNKDTRVHDIKHITTNWDSVQFAASDTQCYWMDTDGILRKGVLKGDKFQDVIHLRRNWKGTELVAQGEYIYWSDGDKKLRQGKVSGKEITEVKVLTDNWTAELFTADNEYLYWKDGDSILRRGKVSNSTIVDVSHIDKNCTATELVAANGFLYWSDGDKKLRQGKVTEGALSVKQILAHDWDAGKGQFAAFGNKLLWCDNDKVLRSGKV